VSAPKPRDYAARRQWQLDARARGEVPECGREACTSSVGRRPFVGSGTGVELEYCPPCARMINEANGCDVCTPKELFRG